MKSAYLGCLLLCSIGCQHAEPRRLLDRLPGKYPDVIYYFPTNVPLIALTIDDGLDPTTTPALLDILAKHQAKATFFLVSDAMREHPELVQAIVNAGHQLGNHLSRDEPSLRLGREEFAAQLSESKEVIDCYQPSPWFRLGHARYNEQMLAALDPLGYRIALGSMIPLGGLARRCECLHSLDDKSSIHTSSDRQGYRSSNQ